MGVRGLETFLQNQVPNGVFSINILDEIDRMKREQQDQSIVLVFQVVDILYNAFIQMTTAAEILCGPAFRKIHNIFDANFHQLATISGIELHFFVNEPSYHKDSEAWASKEAEQYSSRIALIDKIDSNVAIEEMEKMDLQPGATASMADLLTICEKYGTVHFRISSKYVADVVNFANERNAMAIIGNNSHLLIFHGDWRYWSCRHWNTSWNTLEYNRNALLEHIGLSRLQMPMLATIAGNEFVPRKKTASFHKSLSGNKFLQLAAYVQQIPNVLTNEEKREFLLDVFGSSASHNFEMVRESLLFYTSKTQESTEMDTLLTSAATISAIYYNSLTTAPIRIKSPTFYDLRRSDFLPFYDIILPILRRQIGFVRKHLNDKDDYEHVVECRQNHFEPIRSVCVKPEYPIVEVPDLMDISFNRNSDHFNGIRFRLLKWMVFGDSDIHFLFFVRHIPKGFMVTVMAVMYLCKLKQLTDLEADAILLSIHLIHENEDYAKGLDRSTHHISSRDVLALHLYILIHNMVVKCFLFLGLNGFVDYLSIDGFYFVHWLNKMKSGEDGETLSQIKHLKNFLRFI